MIVSAPGKIILHGEHAVVYGKAAIATSLNLRNFLMLTEIQSDMVELKLPSIEMHKLWSISDLQKIPMPVQGDLFDPLPAEESEIRKLTEFLNLEDGLEPRNLAPVTFLYLYVSIFHNRPLPSISIHVKSLMPVSAGLGSSAGYCTCLAAALLRLHGILQMPVSINNDGNLSWSTEERKLINKWAFIGEKILHGRPSGIDNSVSTFGGAIRFQSGQISTLENMPKLKILLTNTKVPRSTKVLVENVKNRHTKFPRIIQPLLDSIEEITEAFQNLLKDDITTDDSHTMMEELIDMNQHILSALGVGHPQLDRIYQITAKYGLNTKLTGAGGGGCTFTLLKEDMDVCVIKKVKHELESQGFECWETVIGGSGVMEHSDSEDIISLFS